MAVIFKIAQSVKIIDNISVFSEVAIFICDHNLHLLTETEGNSMFCGPETVDV